MNRRLRSAILLAAIVGGLYAIAENKEPALSAAASAKESYRLVHAIGNAEKVVAKDLTKRECETQKADRKALVALLGVGGSMTCLPESLFND